MAAFPGEVPVFVDTNLGTHVAMNVLPDITAGVFKRDFERVHIACLPNLGKIQVSGLMVKRKSCFYHLPDSLPIKYAFQGTRGTWFLHVEVWHLKKLDMPFMPPAVNSLLDSKDLMACASEDRVKDNSEEKKLEGRHQAESSLNEHGSAINISKKQKNKKRNCNKKYIQNAVSAVLEESSCRFEENPTGTTNKSQQMIPEKVVKNLECNANSMQGSLSEMSTQVISVTGIINKYFSSYKGAGNCGSPSDSDVTSKAFHSEIEEQSKTYTDSFTRFTPRTPKSSLRAQSLVRSVSKNSGIKSRTKVGKCLVVASQNLGTSLKKRSPAISLCRLKDGKLSGHQVSQINWSIFEMSDDED